MPATKTSFRFAIIIAAIIVLVFAGWYATRPEPTAVDLVTVTRGTVEATIVNTRAGTIKACRRANLAPVSGGQIARLWVHEGQRVEKNQALLELWNADLVAQRELARRQLSIARKRSREACIIAENARRESVRTQQLVDKHFVSSQRAEDADANAQAHQASCDAATSDIKRAQAQIQVIEAGLERTILTAPFAGIIARITGELGEYTTPSPPGIPTPPTIDLIDDSCLYVSAPMDEVDAPKIKIGQPARITLDAMPGRIFDGRVRRIAPYVTEIEKQARTVDIEVDFAQIPKYPLLVGYSADVEAIIEKHDNVLRVPTQTIRQNNKVLVVDANNKLEERSLETGLANWGFTEILSGLKAGDQVVSSFDQGDIQAGLHVQPKNSEP
ncbi:HlyD family secretion protein [Nitrosomonas cryotolerans]|uniref:HlyD family secretion protein n=1 Tax=Nitrosomonas cryotolerans ATCC 49181 TaxID=1131553 RepID=A0A1N6JHJ8_9PROT|nr:efflux RND transporter periplasmic adaptor subunit [Nitrosomonas cryotolerans]SFP88839.1 HlyD family secretion protein [Nitrosomonas cryotolerans]SIO43874.1 HlyD family secretion protein [Nitrosomonas cryotolerans ATCC 49181]